MEYLNSLKRAHYKIVGNKKHSAVSTCHWTKESILRDRVCYKEHFYGIKSHRCLQMTPCVNCMQRCVFCWRPVDISPASWELKEYDEPGEILEEAVSAQRSLLEGYGGIAHKINKKKFEEAQNPNQVAISLAGEPTIYPKIGEFIGLCRKRKMSTFLVTNGMLPERLEEIELPTQLYISLCAPDQKTHQKVNIPMLKDSWERLNRSLELMSALDTRRVIRTTLLRGWNNVRPQDYAKLILKSGADFVEVKSYMCVGYSRQRLKYGDMMSHNEVRDFALKLGKETGYEIAGEQPVSRVVVLSSGKKGLKIKNV